MRTTDDYATGRWEAETIINFNEEEDTAELYTASSRVHKLLTARGLKPARVDRDNSGRDRGWFFTLDKTMVLIKPSTHSIRIGGTHRTASTVSSDAVAATSQGGS